MTGKRGFVTQPKEVAIMKGVYRPSRHGDLTKPELRYLNYIPAAPQNLNQDGAEFWTEMLGELIRIDGLIAFHYLAQFEMFCYNYQIIRLCQQNMGDMILTTNSKTGVLEPNPYWKVYNDAYKNFINLSRDFGCTPSAMDRLNLKVEDEKKDLKEQFKL